MLEKGADIEGKSSGGTTALSDAAGLRRPEVVKLLLNKGANIEARDDGGTTALMRAAFGGSADVVRLLLDKGANVNARSHDGASALDLAIGMNKNNGSWTPVVKLLQSRGAR